MPEYPFDPEELSDAAQALLVKSGSTQRYNLAQQLRDDAKSEPTHNCLIALAWTLTEIVESGVYVDDLWNDIQEAQKALDAALTLDPALMQHGPSSEQKIRTGVVFDRIQKFEQAAQAKLTKAKSKSDSDLSGKEAADIAYESKNPEEMAHFFLLAAKKVEATEPGNATWYLNSRTQALLDLSRWDEAEPQLRRMISGDASVDFWVEQGFVGLLRIAAAKSDKRAFRKIWRQARSASAAIPGKTPHYYKVLRFGLEQDMSDFVGPVFERLTKNKSYKKSKEDRELLELASDYLARKPPQTPLSRLRSLIRFRK